MYKSVYLALSLYIHLCVCLGGLGVGIHTFVMCNCIQVEREEKGRVGEGDIFTRSQSSLPDVFISEG